MNSPSDNSAEGGSKDNKMTNNKRRKITTLACENCRSSHLKCDGAETCGSCTRKGLTCVYPESRRRGRKPSKILTDESNKKCKIEDFQFSTRLNQKNRDNTESNDHITYIPPQYHQNPLPSLNLFPLHDKSHYMYHNFADIQNYSQSSLSSYNILSHQDTSKFIYTITNIYSHYCIFLFPFIQLSDPLVALQYLSTPINMLSKEDKIHYGGINAVLAIGSFLARSDYQCEEFTRISHIIAKEIAFESHTITLSCAFSLFAYLSKIRDEKEKAELYIQYAFSICKSLQLVDTEIGQIVLSMGTIISKYNRKKRLQKLSRNPTASLFSMISYIFLIFYKSDSEISSEDKLFSTLDDIDIAISKKKSENELEHIIIKLMTNIARSYIFMKKGRSDVAVDSAKFCIKSLEESKTHIPYFPLHFVKLLINLYKVLVEYNLTEDIEIVKYYIGLLPYKKLIKRKMDKISKNVININNDTITS